MNASDPRHAADDYRPMTEAEAMAIVKQLIREGRMLTEEQFWKAYREAVRKTLEEYLRKRRQVEDQ